MANTPQHPTQTCAWSEPARLGGLQFLHHNLFNVIKRMIGQCFVNLTDHLIRHFLMQLLAQFS